MNWAGTPETPFEEGIVKTIDWYLAHEEWMANVTSGNYQKYYQEMYKTNNPPPHVKRMGRTGLEGYITGRPL